MQTGVAQDTLVFGSIRWVKWSEFLVDNAVFPIDTGTGTVPLVEVEDTTTYTIGVGRKFTENWSGALSFLYESREGDTVSPLAPTNGRKGVTLAAIASRSSVSAAGSMRSKSVLAMEAPNCTDEIEHSTSSTPATMPLVERRRMRGTAPA